MKQLLIAFLCLGLSSVTFADISNTASCTYKDGSNNSYNATSNTVVITVTVVVTPSITLVKSATPMTASPGTVVTFTINYSNPTTATASHVVLVDPVPSGSTLVNGSVSSSGSVSGDTVTWSIGDVPGNGSGTVSFQVTVN